MKIPRYEVGKIDGGAVFFTEKADGFWCKWEDVQAALAKDQEEGLKRLKMMFAQARATTCPWPTRYRFDEEGDVNDSKA